MKVKKRFRLKKLPPPRTKPQRRRVVKKPKRMMTAAAVAAVAVAAIVIVISSLIIHMDAPTDSIAQNPCSSEAAVFTVLPMPLRCHRVLMTPAVQEC
jgi:hypothetical protein